MADDIMCEFERHKTAQAMWIALKDKFGGTSTTKLRRLTIKFDTYKLKPNNPMKQHLREMANMIRELKEAGHVLSDEQQVQAVIRSLPASWEHMKEAMAYAGEFKGRVCVTGASGFLASWLIKRLLSSGYHVTATVRDLGNEKKLQHLQKLEGAKERLRLVKADLMVEGSFDDAIMGCTGVFHTASPVLKPSSDPKEEILKPAIEGTLNVLRSCGKSKSLRRVVLTSSSSAARVRDDFDPNVPIDESSWSSTQLCDKLEIWYALSKTMAERAAWDFCRDNGIDLVTVLPSFVIGPSLPPQLCSTASDVLGLLQGESEKFGWHGRMGYVHIDDVALCHILVYENEAASGRYLCSSTVLDNHDLAALLALRFPWLPIPTRFEKHDRPYYELNTSKIRNLGLKFRSVEEMFDDCVLSLEQQGHLPPRPAITTST
ncbi:tetraketide alpha-pyrone reductase 1-like [Neltuma alba]|uniref:tetraketide alpha-pyrone reductase 1-like n=1 Tax=Neltuma alba TaxID=207710 RepID=UPI0010A2E43E|nr:tetraketide alpha-pyrone reductase 1-like [Prosopis alba]XP_028789055.1 tetraketide alpha-pyrone reductase 1-like [Prosopis alba]